MKLVMNYISPDFGARARLRGKHQPRHARFGGRDGALRRPAPRAAAQQFALNHLHTVFVPPADSRAETSQHDVLTR